MPRTLPRNCFQNRINAKDLLGETPVKDNEQGSKKRQGEDSDSDSCDGSRREGLLKKRLRLQAVARKPCLVRWGVLKAKVLIGVVVNLVVQGLY